MAKGKNSKTAAKPTEVKAEKIADEDAGKPPFATVTDASGKTIGDGTSIATLTPDDSDPDLEAHRAARKARMDAAASAGGNATQSDDEDVAAEAQIVEPDPEAMEGVSERDLKSEVAARSVDIHTQTTSKHRKVFAILTEAGKLAEDYDHGPNRLATVGYLMQNGLRPTGGVELASTSVRTDGVTLDLTYEVTAIPADLALPADPDTVDAQ